MNLTTQLISASGLLIFALLLFLGAYFLTSKKREQQQNLNISFLRRKLKNVFLFTLIILAFAALLGIILVFKDN